MFGLTLEKLLLVGLLAAVLVGPTRLPEHAAQLARLVRQFRAFVESTKDQARIDTGVDLSTAGWRQYDPRVVVREALAEPLHSPEVLEQAARIRPGQKYVVTGSAAHPQRLLLASLPAGDPRRLAAEV